MAPNIDPLKVVVLEARGPSKGIFVLTCRGDRNDERDRVAVIGLVGMRPEEPTHLLVGVSPSGTLLQARTKVKESFALSTPAGRSTLAVRALNDHEPRRAVGLFEDNVDPHVIAARDRFGGIILRIGNPELRRKDGMHAVQSAAQLGATAGP